MIARALARDQGGGAESARLIANMMLILLLAPLLAPSLGSGVLTLFDWCEIFWALAIFGTAAAFATHAYVSESVPPERRRPISVPSLLRDFAYLLRARDFVGGVAVQVSVFAGYAAFVAISAAVAELRFGVSPEAFGPLFGVAAIALLLGSTLAHHALGRFGVEAVLSAGAIVAAIAGIGVLAAPDTQPGLTVSGASPSSTCSPWA